MSGYDQGSAEDNEETLESLALDLWEVCAQLEREGEHEAAQELRDQCECVVRDMVAEAIE